MNYGTNDGEEVDLERMNKAVETLKEWAKKVNEVLEKEFDDHIKRAGKIHPEGARIVEHLKEYTLRSGKRIRPACIIAGYKAMGGESEEIFSASASIEAIQTYLLIHDDVIDEDDLRRGGPALHKLYRELHEKNNYKGNSKKFGWDMAILAGDLANSFGVDQLAKSNFDSEKKGKTVRKLEEIHRHTAYGEVLDVIFNYKTIDEVTEKDTDLVYELKTAHYTIAGPLEMGAILAGGTKEQKESLMKYGMKVGSAFQLADDLLVLYGKQEKIGKRVGTDLEEGNKTIPLLIAYKRGNEKQRKLIRETINKKNIPQETVQEIGEIIKETGAYDYCKNKVEKLIKEGKKEIENAEIDPKMKDFLLGIADYIITREA